MYLHHTTPIRFCQQNTEILKKFLRCSMEIIIHAGMDRCTPATKKQNRLASGNECKPVCLPGFENRPCEVVKMYTHATAVILSAFSLPVTMQSIQHGCFLRDNLPRILFFSVPHHPTDFSGASTGNSRILPIR